MRRWINRAWAAWHRSRIRKEIAEEVQFHIDQRITENRRRGMSIEDATADALRRFGPRLHIEEQGYDIRGARWLDTLTADCRYALRILGKNPGFTAVAVLTLALGIGANLAIFTIVNAVLLRPLPFHDPDRLVRVLDDLNGAGASNVGMSVPEFFDLSRRTDIFDRLAVIYPANTALSGGDRVERIELLGTTPNYFDVLGADAALGRVYTQSDWQPGFSEGAVISDGLWTRQFGRDPHVIGRRIRVDEDGYTIIGVMPPDFHHPGQTLGSDVEIWAAAGFIAAPFPAPPVRAARNLPGAIGRLKHGVTIRQAQQQLDAVVDELQRTYPQDYPRQLRWSLRVEAAQESLTDDVRPMLIVLFAAVSFVLLIVCVNVAGLLVARSSTRAREFAIRQAVGASRGRLIRQTLTESVLMSIAGTAAALVALWVTRASIVGTMPADLPRLAEVNADWRTLALSLALALGTGLLFGIAPALHASAIDPNNDLKQGGRTGGSQGAGQGRSRSALVMVEIALAVVLLSGAGLLMRSFAAMLQESPGVNPHGITMAQIWIPVPNNPGANRYFKNPQRAALGREVVRRVSSLPGVDAAAIGGASDVPFLSVPRNTVPFSFADEASSRQDDHAAAFGSVSPGYFTLLGIPVAAGRVFTDHDGDQANAVAVVNQAFVRKFSGTRNPIGRRLRFRNAELDIVGVVDDVRDEGLDVPARPRVYSPMWQRPAYALAVFLRTHADVDSTREALIRTIHDVDADLPVFGVKTMDELMSASMTRRRFSLLLMSIFALVALFLAALGVYGVMAFTVSQRKEEFSIRMALGAQARDIVTLAVRPGAVVAAAGIAAGLAIAVATTRLMSSLLFRISPADPMTFGLVAAVLSIVALVACFIPARRATRASPMDLLRGL